MDEGDIIGSVMYQRHIENDLKFEGKSIRDLISTHELESFVSNYLIKEKEDSEKFIKLNEMAKFLYENGFFSHAIKISQLTISLIKENPNDEIYQKCLLRIENSHKFLGT